ncbi:MAG: FliM/FliN family flagellar motor switch protein [Hyphomicrobiaceae bacterium]
MQTEAHSSKGDLEAILTFLEVNKSQLGDGDGVKNILSTYAECLSEEVFAGLGDQVSFLPAEHHTEGFDELLGSASDDIVFGQIHSPQVLKPIYVFIDGKSLATFIDLKFGGDGERSSVADTRGVSMLDRAIAELLFEHMAAALTETMSTVAWRSEIFTEKFLSSSIAGIPHCNETYEQFKLHIDNDEIELSVMICFPSDMIELFRSEIETEHEEKAHQAHDPDWKLHVENEILQSRIGLRVLVAQQEFSIADVSQIAVGQVFPINAKTDDNFPILGDGNVLFLSRIGQLNGAYAMRVADVLEPMKKFENKG